MKVLFVCTGNVFRSMTAEYCLRDYAKKHNMKDLIVSSAGIVAHKEDPRLMTISTLASFGINVNHKQTKLTKEVFDSCDIAVAMAKNHQEFIKKNFNVDVPLFNEVCFGKKTSVKDLDDVILDWATNDKAANEYVREIVIYIHDSIPSLVKNLNKFV